MSATSLDPEFKALMPSLTVEEFNQLEENILEWGCKDRLTVWAVDESVDATADVCLVLLDGHNRYQICGKHNIPFGVEEIELRDRDAAVDWIVKHQLSRRNLTPEQVSYYRGLQYEREKGKQGRPEKRAKNLPLNDGNGKTVEKLAEQHKVSHQTIKNDVQFARAVDTVDKAVGNGARTALLSRDTKVTKQDAVKLGAVA